MDFIKGMDVSSYQEMLDKGYRYYDENGEEVDILEYAVKKGFNYGRIRIWNCPENVEYSGGYCNLEQTILLAKKMKTLGIPYLLDFHYSDWWADPGNQNKPKDWEDLHGEKLENAVYEYTKYVMEKLAANHVSPSMVQIGNEIRCGMMWPDGDTQHFDELARLINAGIRAVRDVDKSGNIQIMIHLDQGGRYHFFEEWFDKVISLGVVDFDVIGLSYYPFWHGSYKDFDDTMNALARKYHKEQIAVETAYAYRLADDSLFGHGQERLGGYLASPQGQHNALQIIAGVIAGTEGGLGKGFFYWEPFCRSEEPGNWGYAMGMVDEDGRPLEVMHHLDDIVITVDEARKMYQQLTYGDDCSTPVEGEIVKDLLSENIHMDIPDNVDFVWNETMHMFKFISTGNAKFSLSNVVDIEESGNYIFVAEYKGENTTGVKICPFVKWDGQNRETNIYPSDTMWTRATIELSLDRGTKLEFGIDIDSPQISGEIRNMAIYRR